MKILPYIYDFISDIFEEPLLKRNIKHIFLFGSVAKGTFDKKSDIDLFFDIINVNRIAEVETKLKEKLKSFQIKVERTWSLKGIALPIKPIAGSIDSETWANLRDEIISSGLVVYGPYNKMPSNLNHYSLFHYSLNNLKRKEKMKFIRKMFGYSLKKGKKEYKQAGLLEEINGKKLSSNVVLVDSKNISTIKRLFNESNIRYGVFDSWIRL